MISGEFSAGADQTIVVYESYDTGGEIDMAAFVASVAEDAARRAAAGQRIHTMTGLPMRHAGAFLGRDGSGYETLAALIVVYEPVPRD